MNAIETALKTVMSAVSEDLAKDIRRELSTNESFAQFFDAATNAESATQTLDAAQFSQIQISPSANDLTTIQRSLRNTYSVEQSEGGMFNVLYPSGGVIGTYDSEVFANRMARAFEAGKASMIYSANFQVARTTESEETLRKEGFTEADIDAAFLTQEANKAKSQNILRNMLITEFNTLETGSKREQAVSFYRSIVPNNLLETFAF